MAKCNAEVISAQRDRLLALLQKHVSQGSRYALLDFPNHPNVGDSAIWLGEVKLLRAVTGRRPSYVSTTGSFRRDDLVEACPSGPIFLHGGGNFGDIWNKHQDFREALLGQFPDRAIIQLPQTIKFSSAQRVTQCARAIAKHRGLHIYVRDRGSETFGRDCFDCPVELGPDSAFGLGELARPAPPVNDLVFLLRTDIERADYDRADFASVPSSVTVDWLDERKDFRKRTRYGALRQAILSAAFSLAKRREIFYHRLAMGRLQRGLRILSTGQSVITDRLHGHILSTLLDIPHIALDNSYGKVSAYITTWTASYSKVLTASTAAEALERLPSLRSELRGSK